MSAPRLVAYADELAGIAQRLDEIAGTLQHERTTCSKCGLQHAANHGEWQLHGSTVALAKKARKLAADARRLHGRARVAKALAS